MADLTTLTAELAGMKQKMVDRLVAQGDETIQPDDTMQTIVDHFDNLRTKIVNQDKEITANGEYTADEGYTGLGKVTVDVKAEPVPKYGATVDTFLGDVDENGVLLAPTTLVDLDFSGIKSVVLSSRFSSLPSIRSVNMSDIITIVGQCCDNTFAWCNQLVSARLDNLETIQGASSCSGMFNGCSLLSEINIGKLRQIGDANRPTNLGHDSCRIMFQGCKRLKVVDLGNLEYIYSGSSCSYMFNDCSGLENINLSKLKVIHGGNACEYMFGDCAMQTVDLSSLETINGFHICYYMFHDAKKLQSINLSNLRSVTGGQAFGYFCSGTAITTFSFPSLTEVTTATAFQYAFNGCNTLTEIHFRADMQATIEALTDYSKKFGAPSTCTIYFDL